MQVEIAVCQCLAPGQDVLQMGLFNNASVLKNEGVLFLKRPTASEFPSLPSNDIVQKTDSHTTSSRHISI